MLPLLTAYLSKFESAFQVFQYLTLRGILAAGTALAISLLVGRPMIRRLNHYQVGQSVRDDGPQTHLGKTGTPTMGGVLILLSVAISTLLWMDLGNGYVWSVLIVTLGFGMLGFYDDYQKLTKRSSEGLPSRLKLAGQIVISLVATYWIMSLGWDAQFKYQIDPETPLATGLSIPFMKEYMLDLGRFVFIFFAVCVMVGASNAVNLTDGLDGLAIVPVMIAAGVFGLIAYMVGNAVFANHLQLTFVPGSGELAVFCGALVGAALGFLWFNAPPAMVFMGDTGSLSMGGALGAIAVAVKHEIVLAIVGGLFVLETVSVIVQVASFKLTGKRVFRMAPIHHHFEQKGWHEPTIVVRFWIIAAILAIVGLSTLKLR